jgi:hypothetical protein
MPSSGTTRSRASGWHAPCDNGADAIALDAVQKPCEALAAFDRLGAANRGVAIPIVARDLEPARLANASRNRAANSHGSQCSAVAIGWGRPQWVMRPSESYRPIVANGLFEGEFDPALNAVGHVVDVDRPAQFVRNKLADHARAIAAPGWNPNRRTTDLLPSDREFGMRAPIGPTFPVHADPTTRRR